MRIACCRCSTCAPQAIQLRPLALTFSTVPPGAINGATPSGATYHTTPPLRPRPLARLRAATRFFSTTPPGAEPPPPRAITAPPGPRLIEGGGFGGGDSRMARTAITQRCTPLFASNCSSRSRSTTPSSVWCTPSSRALPALAFGGVPRGVCGNLAYFHGYSLQLLRQYGDRM